MVTKKDNNSYNHEDSISNLTTNQLGIRIAVNLSATTLVYISLPTVVYRHKTDKQSMCFCVCEMFSIHSSVCIDFYIVVSRLSLIRNNQEIVSAWGDTNGYQTAANSVILTLNQGDRVYLVLQEGELMSS